MNIFSASIDTTRIIKDSDYEKLDQCIPFLIRSSVGNLLNVRILDPAIARIYIISQLCLQYLLFCTKFLDKSVSQLRDNVYNYQKQTLKLEEILAKRDEEIVQLQKKLKRQEALNQPVFPCTKCTKNFLSAALLDNHVVRKHQKSQIQESKDKDSNLINTIKLELEIKQLKERLIDTEKELMEASSKVGCERCQQNAQRKFQSVAIQSNFEEKEKDDIEKEAICELLNNQMKNFEEWKQNEESRYHSEIDDLRRKLDETIETLKLVGTRQEVVAPSPAPRTMKIADKSINTSVTTPDPKPSGNEWKNRYEELEKMYEEHQKRMTSTVTSIEQTYNEKLAKIEESVKNLNDDREKLHKELQERTEKPHLPLTPKVINKMFTQDSTESSSESEAIVELKPQRKPLTVKPAFPDIERLALDEKQDFSAQKFSVRPKTAKGQKKLSPQKPLRTTRDEAEDLYKQRLKMFGISREDELMNKSEFNRVQSEMVNLRDEKRKKNRTFFITRKKLQSQVDKIFHNKSKSSFSGNFKKGKEVEKENVVGESPNVVVIHPEIPAVKQTFRDDLELMLKKKVPTQEATRGSIQVSRPEEHEQAIQASTSKKKVLFDLKHLNEPNKFEEIREIREEDDSDFDISSFASEAEELK